MPLPVSKKVINGNSYSDESRLAAASNRKVYFTINTHHINAEPAPEQST